MECSGGRIVSPKAVIPGLLITDEIAEIAGATFTLLQRFGQM